MIIVCLINYFFHSTQEKTRTGAKGSPEARRPDRTGATTGPEAGHLSTGETGSATGQAGEKCPRATMTGF